MKLPNGQVVKLLYLFSADALRRRTDSLTGVPVGQRLPMTLSLLALWHEDVPQPPDEGEADPRGRLRTRVWFGPKSKVTDCI